MRASKDIGDLVAIMARLRTPVSGCPWDLDQNFATIAPYTIEEAYEVADAIERGDFDDLRDELGDLLLQVVFHARMAEEEDRFAFGDVVAAITTKLVRRHPHVFGDGEASDPGAVKARWDDIKREEKHERRQRTAAANGGAGDGDAESLLDDVPVALPALTRATKLQKRAAGVGFDWTALAGVLAKFQEETDELVAELAKTPRDDSRLEDELGDVLFAVANLARHLSIEPEVALRRANQKFVRRFRYVEAELRRSNQALADVSLDEMEVLWNEAKELEDDR